MRSEIWTQPLKISKKSSTFMKTYILKNMPTKKTFCVSFMTVLTMPPSTILSQGLDTVCLPGRF